MNTKANARSRQTEAIIGDVFLELLKERPITQISVHEICKRADINRSTFYAHYEDIYDLFRKLGDIHCVELGAAFEDYLRQHPDEKGKIHLQFFLQFIAQHREFYKFSLQYSFTEDTQDMIYRIVWTGFLSSQKDEWRSIPDSVMEYYFSYFWGGFMTVVRRWVTGGCLESPAEIAGIMRSGMENGPAFLTD